MNKNLDKNIFRDSGASKITAAQILSYFIFFRKIRATSLIKNVIMTTCDEPDIYYWEAVIEEINKK